MTSRLRVLVVDDHEPFRRLICELLQQKADLLIVGEAVDGLDAIRQAEALRPDVVILDTGLPMLSGIEVAGRMRARVPDVKVMFVTNESSLEVVEQAFRRGAHGYVYKPRVHRDVLPVNVSELLAKATVNGGPDPLRYLDAARDLLTDVKRRATDHHARIAACGEGTSILWTHGHVEAALQLEHQLDEIAMSRQMDILCAYPLAVRDESVPAVRRLCAEHTAVEIS